MAELQDEDEQTGELQLEGECYRGGSSSMGSSSGLSDFTARQGGEGGKREKRFEHNRVGQFVVLSLMPYVPITFPPRQLCSAGSPGIKTYHQEGFLDNLFSLVQR